MSKVINVRVEDELKEEASELFNSMGLDMTAAIKLFLRQSVIERKIPFEIKAPDILDHESRSSK